MGIFSFFTKQKEFFSVEDKARIVQAIRSSERTTSGEIRVFVESRNPFVDAVDRAAEVFLKLKMEKTQHRNAVLLYIAMTDKELALFGDEGIYQAVGDTYWNNAVKEMISKFSKDNIAEGIEHCVVQIGQTLSEKFPYDETTDKNELPDDIVFGK